MHDIDDRILLASTWRTGREWFREHRPHVSPREQLIVTPGNIDKLRGLVLTREPRIYLLPEGPFFSQEEYETVHATVLRIDNGNEDS